MKISLSILLFSAVLAACATGEQSQSASIRNRSAEKILVDYDGKPCGNQNFHVKMPLCLFPRLKSVTSEPDEGSRLPRRSGSPYDSASGA